MKRGRSVQVAYASSHPRAEQEARPRPAPGGVGVGLRERDVFLGDFKTRAKCVCCVLCDANESIYKTSLHLIHKRFP